MAGVVDVVTPDDGPLRFPSLMAALIAAVSSVTPSPIYQSILVFALISLEEKKKKKLLTGSTIVHDISEDNITTSRVRGESLVSYIGQPV